MRIFHLSDIHLGKQLNGGCSLQEEQVHIIQEIINAAKVYKPDAIVMAGDIYDKSNPSAQTHDMFNDFMNELSLLNIPVFIIAGNHDSPERLNIGSQFMAKHNITISTKVPSSNEEFLEKITLQDDFGDVNFYLLPFMKTGHANRISEQKFTNYSDAIQFMIEREHIDYSKRNVLISHQYFVSGDHLPETRDSETIISSVGGLDHVQVEIVKDFDYVALGHIHSSQRVGYDHIRYCGTPLKYSSSEAHDKKSILMVTLLEKGTVEYEKIPLKMLHDVRVVRGSLDDIIASCTDENKDDYLFVELTNKEDLDRPKQRLDAYYSHILNLKFVGVNDSLFFESESDEKMDPFEVFSDLFLRLEGEALNPKQTSIMKEIIEEAKEEVEV